MRTVTTDSMGEDRWVPFLDDRESQKFSGYRTACTWRGSDPKRASRHRGSSWIELGVSARFAENGSETS